jgi:hypothetical protein
MRSDPESLAVMAAFNVWCSELATLQAACARAQSLGERPLPELRRHSTALLSLQLREAYARGRLQAALQHAIDGADMAIEIDAHWAEFWGEDAARRASELWLELYRPELAGLEQRHAAARQKSEAMKALGH